MAASQVLVLNCGSSSVKVAVLDPVTGQRAVSALGERIGSGEVSATVRRGGQEAPVEVAEDSHAGVLAAVLDAVGEDVRASVAGVGHRVVHGGHRFTESVRVDAAVLDGLREVADLAPLHVPGAIAGIEAAGRVLADVPQVAVFDTAFHATLPPHAFHYAVPRSWHDEHGARRFGFHGISHAYVATRAAEVVGRPLSELRMVTAHLGNGCSATAVRGGVSVDTTMGFTPLEGMAMGTRSGDVDPGLLAYLAPRLRLDIEGLVRVLNTESGLAGLSGEGNDVRSVLAAADAGSAPARLAIEVFTYRVAKAVAALTVPLGRLDVLVFTGGVGEHSAPVRSRVMAGLGVFGITEDAEANEAGGRDSDGRVSTGDGPTVLVVPTDEERVIAGDTARLVGLAPPTV